MVPENPYDLEDFAAFVGSLRLENGQPMELEPFQRTILAGYFKGVEETAVIISKKNGKSSLFAALAIYHLLRVPDAECIIAASSREQARQLFKQAAKLIKNSGLECTKENPDGLLVVKSGYGYIWPRGGNRDGAIVKVISADVNTGDGAIPTLALVDELHRHPNGDLYGVLADGLGPRDGQIITLSTAGSDPLSALGQLRRKAQQMQGYHRDEEAKYACVLSDDFVMHEWSLSDEDDVEDLELVKKVNPLSNQTVEKLRRRRNSPTMTPWRWRRFACGIWTQGEEPWISPVKWNGLPRAASPEPGSSVTVGIRVGMGHQTAAVVWLWRDPEDVYNVGYRLLEADDGLLQEVEEFVRDINDTFEVPFNAYVSKTFDRSAETLSEEGLTMMPYPIGTRTMDMAETLLKVIGEKRLAHEGPGAFTDQVMAGQVKDMPSGWRFIDKPGGTPADALFALAAAVHVAETQQPQEVFFAWS